MTRSALAFVALALVACAGPDPAPGPAPTTPDPAPTTRPADDALRQELLTMMQQDQAERADPNATWNDRERTERLREIVDQYGWPGSDLVGTDGASAAWLIAQHSDHDPAFQQRALDLMRPAADAGLADRTELAYLVDRTALNTGGLQTYGTQVGCEEGVPAPKPLADPETVDQRRAEVGLTPLADYLAEFEEGCAEPPPT